jgi:hypothetical protein
LLPFVRGQQHATVSQAINTVQQGDDSPIGTVEQIVIEHSLHDRNSENVLLALSRDASLLQPMTGRVDEVSAFGPKSGVQNYSALSVNMTGATKIPLRWSVVPAESNDATVVTLVGTQGRMVLFMQGDPSMWTLQGSDVATDSSDHSDEDASLLVADFERLVAGEDGPFFSWSDACRTMEIHTAVRDSLRRGRKIRLYDDQYSEQQTFKGKMAVGGCSLLMLALLFLFGFAIFDGISMPFRDREASPGDPADTTNVWIRLWPAYPLLAFLVLQLLKLVFISDRTASKQPRRSETANAPPQA